ncbi:MAG TPA: coproporphyrinogen III oxidase family protein [Dehalococcoidia bacterium]|nr:coproporphyrinogen III oxidase family protein [Dehalococcoidia bacterium]
MVPVKTLASLTGWVTRREGRKFLKLGKEFDEAIITPSGLGEETRPSLYIHIPFCKSLCPFCCFNRYLFDEAKARQYFRELKQELEIYIEKGFIFSDFYFGGGTPTVLMDELTGFIDYLRSRFAIRRISLETTPREINPENVATLKKAGINRLSIGVQSFDADVLKNMGRPSSPGEEIAEKLLMAEGEFDTLNVDFVFNFPGQSIKQFESDVAKFKELGIDQATFYPLMASPHKKDAMERRFNRINTSQEKRFYDVIIKELYKKDYLASTAWCFSRGERMIDEYIVEDDDYIGIGAGSVSIVGGNFFVNSFSLERYGEFISRERLPIVDWRRLTPHEHMRYYLLTKLFGMKLDKDKFRQRFKSAIDSRLRIEMFFFKTFGLVEGEKLLRVTEKGMYPVSVMMREFFAALNGLREYCIENQV